MLTPPGYKGGLVSKLGLPSVCPITVACAAKIRIAINEPMATPERPNETPCLDRVKVNPAICSLLQEVVNGLLRVGFSEPTARYGHEQESTQYLRQKTK